jgi:death-on-curing protein
LTAYLELADYLLIAEAVLGVPAELIADFNRIGLAESALAAPRAGFGGVEAYPDFATKAAGRVRRAQRRNVDSGTR